MVWLKAAYMTLIYDIVNRSHISWNNYIHWQSNDGIPLLGPHDSHLVWPCKSKSVVTSNSILKTCIRNLHNYILQEGYDIFCVAWRAFVKSAADQKLIYEKFQPSEFPVCCNLSSACFSDRGQDILQLHTILEKQQPSSNPAVHLKSEEDGSPAAGN